MSGMETSSTHLNTELPSTDWMVPDYCAFDGDFQYANTIHQSVLHMLNLLKSEFSRLPLYRREDRSCSCVRSTRSRSSHMGGFVSWSMATTVVRAFFFPFLSRSPARYIKPSRNSRFCRLYHYAYA